MPFTVSHAAAVLPFRRARLTWSALVIGSFGPDFEYFLRMTYTSRAWHSYPDVVIYCFPFTILAFFIYHAFIERPAVALLPNSFQRRIAIASYVPHNFLDASLILLSLALGIATHVLWDSFTHAFSWPWEHIALLRQEIYLPHMREMHGFELLQFISSLSGLLILGVWIVLWRRNTPAKRYAVEGLPPGQRIAICLMIACIAMIGGAWRAYTMLGPAALRFDRRLFVLLFVISSIACCLWALLAYGIATTSWRAITSKK
jgi:Domain of unknown function (DUF4184)